jgi:hypothetical protein
MKRIAGQNSRKRHARVGQSKPDECVPLRIATSDKAAMKLDGEIPKLLSCETVFC